MSTTQSKSNPPNLGAVVSVRGSVVDVRFEDRLPPIYSLLRAGPKDGKGGRIAIEVLTQLDANRVRGIALTPTQGLARGMIVEYTGGPLQAPVGKSHTLAHVRCFRKHHRPWRPARGC